MKVTKKIEVIIDLTDNNHLELLAEMQGLESKMRTEGVDINSTFLTDGQEAPTPEPVKKPTAPPAKKPTPPTPTVKAEEVKETPTPEQTTETEQAQTAEQAPLPISEEDTIDTTQTTAPKTSIDEIKALIAKVASDYDHPEKKADAIKLLNSHKDADGQPVKTSLKLQPKDYDGFYAELSKIWNNGN
jgi:outer membrane biosynthesis protein TonB